MNDIKRGYTDTGYLVVFVREVRLTSRQANQLLGRHTGPASTQLPRAMRYRESGTTQPAVADQRTCGQNPRNDGRRAGRDFSVLEFRRISAALLVSHTRRRHYTRYTAHRVLQVRLLSGIV